ncbi:unnamed protein product, partial [marine sediment metagenome]
MTVTNPYYEFDPAFVPNTKARSDAVNVQYQLIQNAFDFLPGDADGITTGTTTFAVCTGTINNYILTLPDTRTVNQDGDQVVFIADKTNTGAATINVDAIGQVSFKNWDGSLFTGGEIIVGRFYEVRYDAANGEFVLTATLDAALQVTYAEQWAIQPEDTLISVAAGGNGTTDYSALHWAAKSAASASIAIINADIITATPPTNEAVTAALEYWDLDDTDQLASVGFVGSNEFGI